MQIVIMGVSGSGKSTLGQMLADALGVPFLEGDDLHPAANRAKMASGTPLVDADRAPWLAAIAEWMRAHADGVVACSALKHAYRDRLRRGARDARFVLLAPSHAVLAARLGHRRGHFMPTSLLDSQLATLEPPTADEHALVIRADEAAGESLARVRTWLAA